jgi:predicted TIM-barrel fold metal-dependent hydrolase
MSNPAVALSPTRTDRVYDGPIFDGDTHLFETPDAFTKYLPDDVRERCGIHFRHADDGQFALHVGKRKVQITADHYHEDLLVPAPGKLHEWLRAIKEGRSEIELRVAMTPDMLAPAERVKKLDAWKVRSSIIYVGHMLAAVSYLDDVQDAYKVLNAYNHWLLDQWTFNYHDRIYATPIVTLDDLASGIEQVKWCIKNGARAILMPMGPFNKKAPAHHDHDPFWALVNEAKLRVVYHVGEAIYLKSHMAEWGEPVQQSRMRQTAFVWMFGYGERPVVETLTSFIFWNFFERFPNVKLLSAENGAEWVPAMLTKMDKTRGIAKNGYWPGGQLKKRPSKIFAENIAVVAYPEDNLKKIIEQTGTYNWLLMGSDYPHSEGVEEPYMFAQEACRELTVEQTRAIMYENGMRFMDLPL